MVSIWDAAQLDVAGTDGEVVPTFINLADASIKMVGLKPDTLTKLTAVDSFASNGIRALRGANSAECSQHLDSREQPLPPPFQLVELSHPMDSRYPPCHV